MLYSSNKSARSWYPFVSIFRAAPRKAQCIPRPTRVCSRNVAAKRVAGARPPVPPPRSVRVAAAPAAGHPPACGGGVPSAHPLARPAAHTGRAPRAASPVSASLALAVPAPRAPPAPSPPTPSVGRAALSRRARRHPLAAAAAVPPPSPPAAPTFSRGSASRAGVGLCLSPLLPRVCLSLQTGAAACGSRCAAPDAVRRHGCDAAVAAAGEPLLGPRRRPHWVVGAGRHRPARCGWGRQWRRRR